MARTLSMLVALALVACSGDPGPGGADADINAADADPNAPDADPNAPDAAPGCASAPAYAPSWLVDYQTEIVARLSGAMEIQSGVTLSDRSTSSNRAATRSYLQAELSALGYTAELDDYGTGTNVYAELAATNGSTEYVVLGAHFDSVPGSPGANDNATGVAMVMATARYLRQVDCRGRNIIFVFFDQEEIGLVGSQEFAGLLVGASLDVVAVHTVDQMGWDQDGDRAIELERPDTGLYAFYDQTRAAAGMTMTLHQTNTGSTDHVSFRSRGFDAVGVTEEYVNGDTTPHYHKSTDTFATVSFAYLASTTALVNAAFARLVEPQSNAALRGPAVRWDRDSARARRSRDIGPIPGWTADARRRCADSQRQ
jgi:hypothetical protein